MRSCHAARNRGFVVPADPAATAESAASGPAPALAIFHPRTARWHVPAGSDTPPRCPAPSPPAPAPWPVLTFPCGEGVNRNFARSLPPAPPPPRLPPPPPAYSHPTPPSPTF